MSSGEVVLERVGDEFRVFAQLELRRPLAEVFAFFSDAGNLDRITPSTLQFKIVSPLPIEMRPGALIDYKLKIRGVPVRWRSEISVWEPPYRFVDEQRRGPYKKWHHEHRFSEHNGVTTVTDEVHYDLYCKTIVNPLFVAPDVRRIFAYRQKILAEIFA